MIMLITISITVECSGHRHKH